MPVLLQSDMNAVFFIGSKILTPSLMASIFNFLDLGKRSFSSGDHPNSAFGLVMSWTVPWGCTVRLCLQLYRIRRNPQLPKKPGTYQHWRQHRHYRRLRESRSLTTSDHPSWLCHNEVNCRPHISLISWYALPCWEVFDVGIDRMLMMRISQGARISSCQCFWAYVRVAIVLACWEGESASCGHIHQQCCLWCLLDLPIRTVGRHQCGPTLWQR